MGMERGWGWGRLGNDLGEEGPGLLLGGRPGARGGRARAGSACGWWNRAVIRIRSAEAAEITRQRCLFVCF